ncbi:MAG: fibronectin type III domain-containing protein [Chloroflexota bacterium]
MKLRLLLSFCIITGLFGFSAATSSLATNNEQPAASTDFPLPVISNVQVDVDSTSATVTWTTDRPATSAILLSETSLSTAVPDGTTDKVTEHEIVLTDLEPGTTYSYMVISATGNESVTTTDPDVFVTLGPDGEVVPPTVIEEPSPTTVPSLADTSGPTIDVWYDDDQEFGQSGVQQRWINIVGRVTDPDGIASLTYTLNGGNQRTLGIGNAPGPAGQCTNRRLYNNGDFAIEIGIDDSALNVGENTVVIRAEDNDGQVTLEEVTFTYTQGLAPGIFNIDWSDISDIQDVAKAVDGDWEVTEDGGVTAVDIGYDRLLAIGDQSWQDYEVTVPVTVRGFDAAGFQNPSNGPGIGVFMRWQGHYGPDEGIFGNRWWDCQPRMGYSPFGVLGWYRWLAADSAYRLYLYGNNDQPLPGGVDEDFVLDVDTTYIFKVRVETINGGENDGEAEYSMKVWEEGTTEPTSWNMEKVISPNSLPNGSLLLVAHHADADFGDVDVVQLVDGSPVTPTPEPTATPTSEPGVTPTPTSDPGATPTPTSEPGATPTATPTTPAPSNETTYLPIIINASTDE